MANNQGYRLQPSIVIDANATSISIDSNGRVYATIAGSTDPQLQGQIQLATFPNPGGLLQIGENLYAGKPPAQGRPFRVSRARTTAGRSCRAFLRTRTSIPPGR